MGKFSKNYRTFYPNNCQSSSKYGLGIRDPGDGTNPFRIPDPGVKKAPDPGAVLSLTVDKVISITIFISAGTCPVTGREGAGRRAATAALQLLTGHSRQRCDFYYIFTGGGSEGWDDR